MNKVIGPITQNDWVIWQRMRKTIPWMKQDPERFADGIEFEEKWLKEIKEKYIQ